MTLVNDVLRTALDQRRPHDRLPPALADRIARASGAFCHDIGLAAPEPAARLTAALGVPAFECGGMIFLHPAIAAADPAAATLLTHEAAHVLQRRAVPRPGAWSRAEAAEADADRLVSALAQGAPWRPGAFACPPLQPAVPWIALLLVAGGALTLVGAGIAHEEQEALRQQGGLSPDPELHETGWGFVPFVGSLDQMLNGRNLWSQAGGAVFLVLDMTLVGGVLAKTVVRGGIVFATRTGLRQGIEAASRGGGTEAQRLALRQLRAGAGRGEIVLGPKTAVYDALNAHIRSSPGWVIVTGSTGRLNHSVTYLAKRGFTLKLHGGVSRFAYPVGAPRQVGRSTEWLRRFNRFSVYAGEGLLTDAAILEQLRFWQRYQQGLVGPALNRLFAPGCAGTQAILLERLGMFHAPFGSRYLPFLLNRARTQGPYGVHFVVDGLRGRPASAFHAFVAGLLASGYVAGRTLHDMELWVRDQFIRYQMGRVVGLSDMEAAVMEPAPFIDLEDAGGFDSFDVTWPGNWVEDPPDPAEALRRHGVGADGRQQR